jgi:signal transduction histidine kinase
VGARERASSEHDVQIADREEIVRLREEALQARSEVDQARIERERLLGQMREANEKLVVATLHAEELVEQAVAARQAAAAAAAAESEGRERAEALAGQLAANEEALRASNRAKDEFLAMLGHELRNPLAPIVTALDLLSTHEDDHEREHSIIRRHVMHLAHLVDDLLDVSRIASGKIELRLERIELADVVSRAVEIASPLLEAKAHELALDVPRGLVVDADPMRLAQAINNIITNAAKYTPAGGSIIVSGKPHGATIVLSVRDTGIGMSTQMLPRIFDLFTQERQSLDRSAGGLGLGLAIVRSLVTMHGGTIAAHSEGLGHGSELVIELPAATMPIASQPTSAVPREERVASQRILVVDDNRDAAELSALALTGLGHDVRVAFDGLQALAIAQTFCPHIVLLDIGLPVMDGYEVIRTMRSRLPGDTRFIAVTGYGRAADHARSEAAGFDLHLVKPVTIAKLQRSIERVTNQGR